MPKCQNCNCEWSYWDTVKIGFKNNKNCPNCKERQYVSTDSAKKSYAVYFFLLVALIFSRPLFDLNNVIYVLFGIVFILGIVITYPRTIKLSNEQKPLW